MSGGARARRYLWLAAVVVLAVADVRLWSESFVWPIPGMDRDLYLDAARRWLAGEGFYFPWQLAGPYQVQPLQPILYPPTVLWLLVPFTVLPAVLWWLVPLAALIAVCVALRPSPWAVAVIAGLVLWPPSLYAVVAGNPGLWLAAALALGTRWPAFSPLVLLKPTLAPLALWGANRRQWWLGLAVLALLTLPLAAMLSGYLTVLANARSDLGVLYSVAQIPLLLIPLVAWLGRRERVAAVRLQPLA